MKPAHNRSKRGHAFTLVEVLVGLALGLLLVGSVQSLVLGSYRLANAVEVRTSAARQGQLPFELLSADLESLPAGGGLALRDGTLTFSTLNALASPRLATRHAVGVAYELEAGSGASQQLVRRERELGEDSTPGATVVLAAGLRSIAIDVFDGRQWQSRWPLPTPRAARAVRMIVEHQSGQRDERIIQLAPLEWRRHDE